MVLKAHGGTLAFSWLNLAEFGKVSKRQARAADALLDECSPQIFILNPDFFKVICEEDELLAGGKPRAPHADLHSLRFIAEHSLAKRNSLALFPPQDLFGLTPASKIAGNLDAFADLILNRIESLRQNFQNDREFRLAVKRIPKGAPLQCGTRYIARELLGSFLTDKKLRADRNHAIDVCHAVVPVAYCEYVLLDGHWAAQVERARKRINGDGFFFPMA
jgi:hypothetical protein